MIGPRDLSKKNPPAPGPFDQGKEDPLDFTPMKFVMSLSCGCRNLISLAVVHLWSYNAKSRLIPKICYAKLLYATEGRSLSLHSRSSALRGVQVQILSSANILSKEKFFKKNISYHPIINSFSQPYVQHSPTF